MNRILPFADGKFSSTPPPALLNTLTDELLVVASDAVAAVAAQVQPPPSGKGQLRLLAWVVADARGATIPLERSLAETVGKRLAAQAQRVRGQLAQPAADAEEARSVLDAEAAAGSLAPAQVEQRRAAIDAAQQETYTRACQHARSEVYVGFTELDALLPRVEQAASSQPRYPGAAACFEPRAFRPLPPIPSDLAGLLGQKARDELVERFGGRDAWGYDDDPEAHVWWTQILPDFVNTLRDERDAACAARDAARRDSDAAVARQDAAVAARDAADEARDAADEARDAAVEARDAAVEARDAAVDDALTWEWNVVRVQQSQQRRIEMYCARIEELEAERERMIERMIA